MHRALVVACRCATVVAVVDDDLAKRTRGGPACARRGAPPDPKGLARLPASVRAEVSEILSASDIDFDGDITWAEFVAMQPRLRADSHLAAWDALANHHADGDDAAPSLHASLSSTSTTTTAR